MSVISPVEVNVMCYILRELLQTHRALYAGVAGSTVSISGLLSWLVSKFLHCAHLISHAAASSSICRGPRGVRSDPRDARSFTSGHHSSFTCHLLRSKRAEKRKGKREDECEKKPKGAEIFYPFNKPPENK
ncbi:hypothetical protein SAY87_001710 [Trapa incisa]|uniref:Uncharacterized protein n=1 Tax=Trapa incisa TaxID=236973 RepID=A0AAN7JSV0_9MYRT|nr:hypothetical protein SAY87_001710 [Trapa incisa]